MTTPRATEPGLALKGDLNLVFKSLRLRGPKGAQGTARMSRTQRQEYDREVARHVWLALNRAGLSADAAARMKLTRLRLTVVHKGVFDDGSLLASVKPLLDTLKPRSAHVEVVQEQGAPSVRIEAWGPGLPEIKGRVVEI